MSVLEYYNNMAVSHLLKFFVSAYRKCAVDDLAKDRKAKVFDD